MRSSEYYRQPEITLDLYDMDEEQWESGSIVAGGSSAEVIKREEVEDWSSVSTVVFGWGDPAADETFQRLLEHKDNDHSIMLPFSAATVLGERIWHLALQDKDYDPTFDINERNAVVLPPQSYEASEIVEKLLEDEKRTTPPMLSKVGSRYVLLEFAVDFPRRYGGEPERSIYFQRKDTVFKQLRNKVENWHWHEHDDADNFGFTYEVAGKVAREFERQAKLSWGSKEFDASELPVALKTLASWTFRGETIYSSQIRTRTHWRGKDEKVPAKWPTMERLTEEGRSYPEIIELVQSHPELAADYEPPVIIPDEAIRIRVEDSCPASGGCGSSWGIEFFVGPQGIGLNVFGHEDATQGASNFLLTYHDKPRVLCETATILAILTAKHE